jgi:glyoxylase-like metal-dependent hydrolase (beta-lactamase superfamily II)
MNLYPVDTGSFKLDGGPMFGVVPKALWSERYPCDENNLCTWALRCLLVDNGDRKILIDNGVGRKQEKKFLSRYFISTEHSLEASLEQYGFKPEDITDVIVTHLHFDHCGGGVIWNSDRTGYELAFKNATYWCSKAQWHLVKNPNPREKASFFQENIMPMFESGKLRFVEEEGELLPNVSVKIFNGHTNGQLIPYITYKGRTVVFMADLIPSAAHISLPWIMSYDTRPLVALTEKEAFLNEAAENEYILFLEHDFYTECCTVKKGRAGVRLKEKCTLNDVFGEKKPG